MNIPAVGDTGEGIVPREESCHHAKATTGLGELVSSGLNAVVGGVMTAGEHEEAEVERKKEQEEHDGRAQRAQKQDGREDEPACQEEAERRVCHARVNRLSSVGLIRSAGANNVPVGSEHDAVRDPETTVRREGSGTESVANGHFPGENVSYCIVLVAFSDTYHMPARSWTRPP